MFLNHSITLEVFFYWLVFVDVTTLLFILSKMTLLILPILVSDGLISRQGILLGNSSLWSLIVMYRSLSCNRSTLSSNDSFSVIFLASQLILDIFLLLDFF